MNGFIMPTVTLKNIPDELYAHLKEAARAHHRSLNSEILYCVVRILLGRQVTLDDRLAAAQNLRKLSARHPLTDDLLDDAKNQGRP